MKHRDTLDNFRAKREAITIIQFGGPILFGGFLLLVLMVHLHPEPPGGWASAYMLILFLLIVFFICFVLYVFTVKRRDFFRQYLILCDKCGFSINLANLWQCRCGCQNDGWKRSFLESCPSCGKSPSALVCPRDGCETLNYFGKAEDESNVAWIVGKRTWQEIQNERTQRAKADAEARKLPTVQRPVPIRRDPTELLEEKRAMVELAKCEVELCRLQAERAQYNRPKEQTGSIEASVKSLLERINRVLGAQQAAEIVRQQMAQKFANNPRMVAKIESIIRDDLNERA